MDKEEDVEQLEGSDLDAEGEEVDEEYEANFLNGLGVAKGTSHEEVDEDKDEQENEEDDGDEDAVADSSAASDDETSTSTASEVENEWEADSDAAEEAEDSKTTDSHRCVFCGEDEEHDPSDEFEEYLECSVCGDNAHRQCARSASTLDRDEEASRWRCKACLDTGAEADEKLDEEETIKPTSAASKVATELLPGHRGNKPDSHSVFNTLILENDPLDGSRSLRKRKSSEADQQQRPLRKRRRPSDIASTSAGALRSSSPGSAAESGVISVHERQGTSDQEDAGPTRPRPRRSRKFDKPAVHVVSAEGISLILSFNLDREHMQKIINSRPRKNRARDRSKKKIAVAPMMDPEPDHYPAIQSGYSAQFYSFVDKDNDDLKSKPYGGILSEAEADTSKTFPLAADRERFETARLKAEADWKEKMAATNNLPEPTKLSQKMSGPPSKIKCINLGGYEIDTWNAAPYPEEYSRNKILYICEFCLKYMNSDYVAWRHKLKCPQKHPPGDEIYRDGKYSFFEVDGRKNPVYCQNLCLLAKLFLGSKTLYYDVEPFLFYVMTESDELGCHFVGYFSKEKRPSSMNNVSCILVLPIYQRRGFGHMLIEFSYLLTKVEQKTGSPEKPLSDMGLLSYRGYWRLVMCYYLVNQKSPISISQISEDTGMTPDDIISALEALRALVRDPVTKTYALRLDTTYFKEYIAKHEKKDYPRINPEALVWVPYVMNRGLSMHYEGGGPLHTVAPREEEDDEEQTENAAEQASADQGQMSEAHMDPDVDMGDVPTTNGTTSVAGMNGSTAAVDSPADGTNSNPTTPLPNDMDLLPHSAWNQTGTSYNGSYIPPSRFEVFPPVPGISAKRRPGRPFGSRRRTLTPRANSAMKVNGIGLANGSPAERQTRTSRRALGELDMTNGSGTGSGDGHDEEATPTEDKRHNVGLAIQTADDLDSDDGEADAEGEDDI